MADPAVAEIRKIPPKRIMRRKWKEIVVINSACVKFDSFDFKQGKSEGFDICDPPSNLTQIGFKSLIFQPCDLEILLMTSKNFRPPFLHYIKLCASSQTPRWILTAVAVRKSSIRVKIGNFFAPCDLEIQWMTFKNNRDPLLCYIKICASFQSHRWIQTKVRKRSIPAKMGDFFALYDLKIWWITLKNNRAPLLCPFKLCASFYSHQWIQTKVTVRKCSIRIKIRNLLSHVTFKFDGWP